MSYQIILGARTTIKALGNDLIFAVSVNVILHNEQIPFAYEIAVTKN